MRLVALTVIQELKIGFKMFRGGQQTSALRDVRFRPWVHASVPRMLNIDELHCLH